MGPENSGCCHTKTRCVVDKSELSTVSYLRRTNSMKSVKRNNEEESAFGNAFAHHIFDSPWCVYCRTTCNFLPNRFRGEETVTERNKNKGDGTPDCIFVGPVLFLF